MMSDTTELLNVDIGYKDPNSISACTHQNMNCMWMGYAYLLLPLQFLYEEMFQIEGDTPQSFVPIGTTISPSSLPPL